MSGPFPNKLLTKETLGLILKHDGEWWKVCTDPKKPVDGFKWIKWSPKSKYFNSKNIKHHGTIEIQVPKIGAKKFDEGIEQEQQEQQGNNPPSKTNDSKQPETEHSKLNKEHENLPQEVNITQSNSQTNISLEKKIPSLAKLPKKKIEKHNKKPTVEEKTNMISKQQVNETKQSSSSSSSSSTPDDISDRLATSLHVSKTVKIMEPDYLSELPDNYHILFSQVSPYQPDVQAVSPGIDVNLIPENILVQKGTSNVWWQPLRVNHNTCIWQAARHFSPSTNPSFQIGCIEIRVKQASTKVLYYIIAKPK